MSDRDSFIHSIIENPDDNTSRLAFADWIEDRGEAERAEFIRLQIEIFNLGFSGPLSHRVASFAYRSSHKGEIKDRRIIRSVELLHLHGADWLGDQFILVEPAFAGEWAWQRGFLFKISCTVEDFCRHADDLFASHPIRSVKLWGGIDWCLPSTDRDKIVIYPTGTEHYRRGGRRHICNRAKYSCWWGKEAPVIKKILEVEFPGVEFGFRDASV